MKTLLPASTFKSRRIDPRLYAAPVLSCMISLASSSTIHEVEPNNTHETAQMIPASAFSLDFNPDIESSTEIPHVSILGTGDNTYDYFRVTVTEPDSRLIADIDYGQTGGPGSFNSFIALWNVETGLVGQNDNASPWDGGEGSSNGFDSFMDVSGLNPGEYIIGVSRSPNTANASGFTGGNSVPGGATYTLQISLTQSIISEPSIAIDIGEFSGIDHNGTFDFGNVKIGGIGNTEIITVRNAGGEPCAFLSEGIEVRSLGLWISVAAEPVSRVVFARDPEDVGVVVCANWEKNGKDNDGA